MFIPPSPLATLYQNLVCYQFFLLNSTDRIDYEFQFSPKAIMDYYSQKRKKIKE